MPCHTCYLFLFCLAVFCPRSLGGVAALISLPIAVSNGQQKTSSCKAYSCHPLQQATTSQRAKIGPGSNSFHPRSKIRKHFWGGAQACPLKSIFFCSIQRNFFVGFLVLRAVTSMYTKQMLFCCLLSITDLLIYYDLLSLLLRAYFHFSACLQLPLKAELSCHREKQFQFCSFFPPSSEYQLINFNVA